MKNKYILFLLLAVAFQSCSLRVDDVFDKPLAERVNEKKDYYRNLLCTAEHGWLLEYIPSKDKKHGGFNLIMQFEKTDFVTVSELHTDGTIKSDRSTYSLKNDAGPCLNFDTYNKVLNHYSDPAVRPLGKGFEGDYEFIFRTVNEDETLIIVKGKKTRNIMRLSKLKESGDNYLAKVQKMKELITFFPGLEGFSAKDACEQSYFVEYQDVNGIRLILRELDSEGRPAENAKPTNLSFMFTTTGIKLSEPSYAFCKPVQNFDAELVGTKLRLKCTDEGASDIELFSKKREGFLFSYEEYIGNYLMSYRNSQGELKEINVNLTEDVKGVSFTMEGLWFSPIKIKYRVYDGNIIIASQYGLKDDYDLAAWDGVSITDPLCSLLPEIDSFLEGELLGDINDFRIKMMRENNVQISGMYSLFHPKGFILMQNFSPASAAGDISFSEIIFKKK